MQRGPIGEEDAIFGVDALFFEAIQFVEEGGEMNYYAVADDAGGFFVEYSGG